jgi:hypothetical protein
MSGIRTEVGRCENDHEFLHRLADDEAWGAARCDCGAKTVMSIVRFGEGVPDLKSKPRISTTDFKYDKKWNCPNIGRHVRSDIAQHRFNQRRVQEAKNRAAQKRRSKSKKSEEQWEHIGRTPIEVHESVVETLNDRNAWHKDPVGLLKATGTYLGED